MTCNDCEHLSLKEADQTDNREPHKCWHYNIHLQHHGKHPDLPRPEFCTAYK